MNELLLTIISKVKKILNISPEPAVQAKEHKPATKPIVDTEPKKEPVPKPQVKEPLRSTEPKSELIVESKTNKTVTLPQNENLPQDSMLRRHYLTNLRTMIESLKLPRPTDSSLSRHYDSLINAEIDQYVSDKAAIERLIRNYEGHKKTLAQQIQKPKTPAEPLLKAKISPEDTVAQLEDAKPSEDSASSQHTNTNASAKYNIPLPPTDSVLRRHYDTMINTEINNLLNHKED